MTEILISERSKPKNSDEYIEMLRSQLRGNSECGTTHYNLAVALMGKQEYDAAEKELHDAIDCSPSLAEAYVLLGGICLQRGDLEGCLRYNKYATKARAGFAEGYANIGFVLLQLIDGKDEQADEEKLDRAIKNLQKAVIHNANFVQAYTTLGNAYLMKGLVDESIAANLEAIRIQPNFPIAHNNLAVGYLQKKEYELAIFHLDKAKSLGFEVAEAMKQELAPYRKSKLI
ncbi:MAG: tetratricopeptide repeat protein [Desulfamplus sp.]|nr:tetratricopeptide repeat protein [Desulfamplus sp.]